MEVFEKGGTTSNSNNRRVVEEEGNFYRQDQSLRALELAVASGLLKDTSGGCRSHA